MMKKFREYMEHPYTRGDYWGAVAIVAALYAVIGGAYIVYLKVDEWKSNKKKIRKDSDGVYSIEDEEA